MSAQRRRLVLESPPWMKLCRDRFPPPARLDFLADKGKRNSKASALPVSPEPPKRLTISQLLG